MLCNSCTIYPAARAGLQKSYDFSTLAGSMSKIGKSSITFLLLLFSSGIFPKYGKRYISFLLLLLSDPQKTRSEYITAYFFQLSGQQHPASPRKYALSIGKNSLESLSGNYLHPLRGYSTPQTALIRCLQAFFNVLKIALNPLFCQYNDNYLDKLKNMCYNSIIGHLHTIKDKKYFLQKGGQR